jgi:hypothetical protein
MSQPRGISVSLHGSSALGVGCVCNVEDRMWSAMEDGYETCHCARCNRTWHVCPIHRVAVSGEPIRNYNTDVPPCTCKKEWLPPSSNCPFCSFHQFLVPYDTVSTKLCKQCRQMYHTCPLHGKSVEGPGYPLSSREQTMCQCHQNPSFLNKKTWSTPFK